MKTADNQKAVCPKCGAEYFSRPALSRMDGKTLICPDCGTREALDSIGISEKEQNEILAVIHKHYNAE